jgi:hypothetical protein
MGKQLQRQGKSAGRLATKPKCKKSVRFGYAIFMPTFFQGTMPACYERDYPVVFACELEAQREIADNQLTRIQQFIDGERDFDDAISTHEFVLPVKIFPDGSISIEDGRIFSKQD